MSLVLVSAEDSLEQPDVRGTSPQKPYTIQVPAVEGALTRSRLLGSDVLVVSLQRKSLMYHGYAGEKHKLLDRDRLAGIRHDHDSEDECAGDDTYQCYRKTTFVWLEKLVSGEVPFKAAPLFFGPKSTADIYGKNVCNTTVISHTNPSARLSRYGVSRPSETDDSTVPLYQIPQLNGTTITFSATRDIVLVDIGCLENAKQIIEFAKKKQRTYVATENWRDVIDWARKAEYAKCGNLLKRLVDKMDDNFAIQIPYNPYDAYEGIANGTYEVEGKQVVRNSTFEMDASLIDLIKLWLHEMGLENKVDGFFWGGELWTTTKGLDAQEFCIFNPSELLEYVSHTEQTYTLHEGLPTYKAFWENGISREASADLYGVKNNLFSPK
jgi:hypothetical protein